jgi:hypothetical protein
MSAYDDYKAPIEEFAKLAKSSDYEMTPIPDNDYFYLHVLNPEFDGFFILVHDSYKCLDRPLDVKKNSIRKQSENVFSFEARDSHHGPLDFDFTVKFTLKNA